MYRSGTGAEVPVPLGLAGVPPRRKPPAPVNSRHGQRWISVRVVADPRDENGARDRAARAPRPVGDPADEVERARTPRTPLLALTGVWLTIAITVALVLAVVALTLYFVSGGD
jgi:hypothetical protein